MTPRLSFRTHLRNPSLPLHHLSLSTLSSIREVRPLLRALTLGSLLLPLRHLPHGLTSLELTRRTLLPLLSLLLPARIHHLLPTGLLLLTHLLHHLTAVRSLLRLRTGLLLTLLHPSATHLLALRPFLTLWRCLTLNALLPPATTAHLLTLLRSWSLLALRRSRLSQLWLRSLALNLLLMASAAAAVSSTISAASAAALAEHIAVSPDDRDKSECGYRR